MEACIRMAESFRCSTETTTTLLIGYTAIQNEKFKVGGGDKKNTAYIPSGGSRGESVCPCLFQVLRTPVSLGSWQLLHLQSTCDDWPHPDDPG